MGHHVENLFSDALGEKMSWCYSWNFSINLKLFLNKKKENGDKKPYKNYVYGKNMCVYIG